MAEKPSTSTLMFCHVEVPLWTIVQQFEHIATPLAIHVEKHRYDPNSKKITFDFETGKQASEANELKQFLMKQNKFKRRSDWKPYRDSQTMRHSSPKRATPMSSPIKIPSVKSEVHVVNKPNEKRLFCLLPWEGKDKEKDEAFFRHFAQFGKMRRAMHKAWKSSDPIYKATFAQPRKMTRSEILGVETKFHSPCKQEIENNLYTLHEITCKKQLSWTHVENDGKNQSLIKIPTMEQLRETLRYLEHLEKNKVIQQNNNQNVPGPINQTETTTDTNVANKPEPIIGHPNLEIQDADEAEDELLATPDSENDVPFGCDNMSVD